MKIRTLSLFSGIGAFEKALERLGIDHELVAYCEIDKYASKSYSAIHSVPESMNLGDITKVDPKALPDFDLLTWGFPCQDISVAGHLKGIVEGETRSGLYYEGFRILKEKMPKYSIIENVKNLVGKRFRADFDSMLDDIESLGYNNYWQVLNAKDYGIPQNRERVFIVSIRKDVDTGFAFPEKEPSILRLKDILEHEVEEKFYLSEQLLNWLKKHNEQQKEKGNGFIWEPRDLEKYASTLRANGALSATDNTIIAPVRLAGVFDGEVKHQAGSIWDKTMISPTLDTMQGGYRQPCIIAKEATEKGYRVGKQNYQTLTTQSEMGVASDCRVRRLTPKECWRLMGFDDADFEKAEAAGISNSQLYKQAGNSIVVNVLEAIFVQLLKV